MTFVQETIIVDDWEMLLPFAYAPHTPGSALPRGFGSEFCELEF